MSRKLFMDAVVRKNRSGMAVFGTGTSIACRELVEQTGAWFPEAHINAEKMADLAEAGHTAAGLDVVVPLFSVCHEVAADAANAVKAGIDIVGPECAIPLTTPLANLRAVAKIGQTQA